MAADKNIGQLLMIGISGPVLTKEEERFIRTAQPCGVIYFRRNVESPKQLLKLSQSIQRLCEIPALIAIDQEGGSVARLNEPFTTFPGNEHLGRYFLKTGKVDLAKSQAQAMARELKSVGINYNFTPVADVNSNPKNPIIGGMRRSFGTDPKVVARLVSETIKVYRKEKVVSCAKHFPGHGDTFSDSHKVLPTVKTSRAILTKRELVPFVAAIKANVPTMMTAHVVYKALDAKFPATLSRKILNDLLRKKLHYKGVIVSDDLEMNAIAGHGEIDLAAEASIAAGADLLLVCKSLERSQAVYEKLKEADHLKVNTRLSLGRISKLKKQYLTRPVTTPTAVIETGWPNHKRVADQIQRFFS